MNRTLLCATLFVALLSTGDAWGHGGSFRGPNGGVPPGLREPSDPEPPPPPPSDPPGPGGPVTDPQRPPGPDTHDPGGETTPPGNQPAPDPAGNGRQGRTKTKVLSFESWRFWWGYNKDDILNLKSHIYARGASTFSPIVHGSLDNLNTQSTMRPTRRAVKKLVIPALLRVINRPTEHEDVHGGAIVAYGKVGAETAIRLFDDALHNRYRNDRNAPVDFGPQATESAALALGLLPNLDASAKAIVRTICLDAIADEKLRTRDRCWAAVCLGLQRDSQAVAPLFALLGKRYADDNIPAGILAGIGLVGRCDETVEVVEDLVQAVLTGELAGRRISDRLRAFAGYAVGKIGDPSVLPQLTRALTSRRLGRIAKRSAVIAAGVLGGQSIRTEEKDQTVRALRKYLRRTGGDATGANFALIALSQIGTDAALNTLLDVAENGRYGQRPFAALGLGTYVWYREAGEDLDPDTKQRITDTLARLGDKYKDTDTKAAFLLARGLVRDKAAVPELTRIVSRRGGDATLRGYCCVSLGLIGDQNADVKAALKAALSERKSPDLRRDAATGLGLLRDTDAIRILMRELERAKSFAVQAQLITAIGTIGDQKAISPLVRILDDLSQPAATRAMAAVGLGMIGDLRELSPLARLAKNYNYRASVRDLDELLFIL